MFKIIFYIFIFLLKQFKDSFIIFKDITVNLIKYNSKKNKEFKNYLKVNYNYWKNTNNVNRSNPKVLVTDFVSHPGYTTTTSVIGKYISKIENLETIGFVRNFDIRGPQILKSFGIKNICYLKYGGLFKRLMFFLKSIKILKKYKNVDEFINYEEGNIKIGLLVYDHVLRHTQIGSTNKITFKFYLFLAEALGVNNFCKKFFSNNVIHSVIQAEKQFLPSAIIFQNALIHNCKVYSREGGVNCFSVRVCSDFSKSFSNKSLQSKKLFQYVLNNYKDKAIREGKKLINRRFSGLTSSNDLYGAHLSFKVGKKFSKKDLCESLNWDLNKPIIGIFVSDFIDGNFESSWLLFKDNLSYLRSTLKHIKNIKDVNWIVKEHPIIDEKIGKTTTKKEFEIIVGNCEHIALFNNKFNASSLPNCLNLALSSGSVGLEYPCFGIPSLICGESYYGGFGFTYEPRTQEEYFSCLKNINDPKRFKLSKDQVEKAIVYFYICFILTKINVPLIPYYNPSRNFDEKKLWSDFTYLIKNYDQNNDSFYKMLERQIKEKNRHKVDYTKLQ